MLDTTTSRFDDVTVAVLRAGRSAAVRRGRATVQDPVYDREGTRSGHDRVRVGRPPRVRVRDSPRGGCEDAPPPTVDEDLVTPTLPPPVTDGDVLVRLPAGEADWPAALPPVPDDHVLTLTLGHPCLFPPLAHAPLAAGYRLVGVATEQRPIGLTVDVYVPAVVRETHPLWWRAFLVGAERVFDLRLGPVQRVLAAELALHTRPPTDPTR
jgi:hypothetical protein